MRRTCSFFSSWSIKPQKKEWPLALHFYVNITLSIRWNRAFNAFYLFADFVNKPEAEWPEIEPIKASHVKFCFLPVPEICFQFRLFLSVCLKIRSNVNYYMGPCALFIVCGLCKPNYPGLVGQRLSKWLVRIDSLIFYVIRDLLVRQKHHYSKLIMGLVFFSIFH